jgi:hypothetical protein
MVYVLTSNRWFVWTIIGVVIIGVVVWWQVEMYRVELLSGTYNNDAQTYESIKIFRESKILKQQTSVDISKWKTYRNEKYGFEFRYPPVSPRSIYENGYMTENSWGTTFDFNGFSITLDDNAKNLSYTEWFTENLDDSKHVLTKIGFFKEIASYPDSRALFSTFNAPFPDNYDDGPYSVTHIMFFPNHKVVTFHLGQDKADLVKYVDDFSKLGEVLLPTLKFFEPTAQ